MSVRPPILPACAVVGVALNAGACFGASGTPVVLTGAPPASSASAPAAPAAPDVVWAERFDGPSVAWVTPLGGLAGKADRVFSVKREGAMTFLHARHDGTPEAEKVGFVHFGKLFEPHGPPLDQVRSLRWKWRVRRHPANTTNPWGDVAASVYAIVKPPSLLGGGKGFRFGWLSARGVTGTFRVGLARVPLREQPASDEWMSEEIDVCALFREMFGPCEGEHLNYVGVATEADDTQSIAEADYTDFELRVRR